MTHPAVLERVYEMDKQKAGLVGWIFFGGFGLLGGDVAVWLPDEQRRDEDSNDTDTGDNSVHS